MKPCAAAASAAPSISAWLAPGRPKPILAAMVSSNSTTSCDTTATAARREAVITSRTSWPSMVTRPPVTS